MKRALLSLALLAGCGGSDELAPFDLAAPQDLSAPRDLPRQSDLFSGHYQCQQTLDQYCGAASLCPTLQQELTPPYLACGVFGASVLGCGPWTYLISDNDGVPFQTFIFDSASGQLIAILGGGPTGAAGCLAGPPQFDDPQAFGCTGDGGAEYRLCAGSGVVGCGLAGANKCT